MALQAANGVTVLQAVCDAIGTLPPGAHEAPLSALAQPLLTVLSAFAADANAACAAAAQQGLLMSVATAPDGVVRDAQLRDLGLDEAAAEALVAEGRRSGGRVAWNPAVVRPDKLSVAVVVAMLRRLSKVVSELRVDRDSVARAAGLPSSDELVELRRVHGPEAEAGASQAWMGGGFPTVGWRVGVGGRGFRVSPALTSTHFGPSIPPQPLPPPSHHTTQRPAARSSTRSWLQTRP